MQTGKSKSDLTADDKASLSDVLNMVRFLQRVATNEDGWAVATIDRILAGTLRSPRRARAATSSPTSC